MEKLSCVRGFWVARPQSQPSAMNATSTGVRISFEDTFTQASIRWAVLIGVPVRIDALRTQVNPELLASRDRFEARAVDCSSSEIRLSFAYVLVFTCM